MPPPSAPPRSPLGVETSICAAVSHLGWGVR
jgi:hypothetical protein